MNEKQIIDTIELLAKSGQGLYSRLLNAINKTKEERPNDYKDFMKSLEEKKFKDVVDLVLYFET